MIKIDTRNASKALDDLRGNLSEAQIQGVLSRAINHTAKKAQTQANKSIREEYRLSAAMVRQRQTISLSSKTSLRATISAKTRPISLHHFRPTKVSAGVKIGVKRSGRKTIKGAFLAKGKGGVMLVWARGKYQPDKFIPSKDGPPTVLRTVSLSTLYNTKHVWKALNEQIDRDLPKRIDHEVNRILNRRR